MHPLFRCRVSKLVNDPAFPEFDVAVTSYGPMPRSSGNPTCLQINHHIRVG